MKQPTIKRSSTSLLSLAGEEREDADADEVVGGRKTRGEKRKPGLWHRLMGGTAWTRTSRKEATEPPGTSEKPGRGAREEGHAELPSAPVAAPAWRAGDQELFGSLIDLNIAIDAIRDRRGTIAALAGLGLLAGVLVAISTPHRYTATAEIFFDPRELKLVERDIAPDYLANEGALAIVDSKLALAQSAAVIDSVVERAGLADDPEFTGSPGIFDGILAPAERFLSVLSADDGAEDAGRVAGDGSEDARRAAASALRASVSAKRANRTFVVEIGVTTLDPEKSAMLANEVAKLFIEEQENLRADTARSATDALGGRLQVLRTRVAEAEEALQNYRAESGLVGPAGRLLTDDQLTAVTAQLADARAATFAARARVETIEATDLANVVAGALPQRMATPALNSLRTRYAEQRRQLATLENRLGPRHPRLAEAQAALRSVESEITAELRRIGEGAQADLRAATRNEQALEGELAMLKAQSVGNGDAQIRLRELERELAAAREIYESFLRRASETGEIENLDATNASIISPAVPPNGPSSMSRKMIVAGYGLAGLTLGLLVALFAGLRTVFADHARRPLPEGPASPDPSPPPRGRPREDRPVPGIVGRPAGPATAAPAPGATMSSRAKEHQKAMYPYRNAPYHPEQDPYRHQEQPQYGGPTDPQGYYPAPRGPEYPPMPQQAYPAPGYPQQYHPAHHQAWDRPPMPPQPQPYAAPDRYYGPYGHGYPAQPQYPQQHQPMPAFRPGHPSYGRPETAQPESRPEPQQQAPRRQEATDSPRGNVYRFNAEPDEEELLDLRNSLREIRDTVETLIKRRTDRERWSA